MTKARAVTSRWQMSRPALKAHPGFDKNNVVSDIRLAGLAMKDGNFNLGSDLVAYRIDAGTSRPVKFSTELKHQSLTPGLIKDLFRDNHNPEVAKF